MQPSARTAAFNARRTLVAVVLGESIPIVALILVIFAWGPSGTEAAEVFARQAGNWIGPLVGAVSVLALACWAGRCVGQPVVQGAFIGVALALLDFAILATIDEPFSWLVVLSNGGKILAGIAGGFLAGQRSTGGRAGASNLDVPG